MTTPPTDTIEVCIILADESGWGRTSFKAKKQLKALKADNALAWQLVDVARTSLMMWGEYADDYTKGRHNYDEVMGWLDDALAKHEGDTQ